MASCNNYSIFLYAGQGTSPICVEETKKSLEKNCSKYSVILVDSSYISRDGPPDLFVLPGGSTMTMLIGLKNAIAKIKSCVEKGSGFFGICAGAIIASSKWDY